MITLPKEKVVEQHCWRCPSTRRLLFVGSFPFFDGDGGEE